MKNDISRFKNRVLFAVVSYLINSFILFLRLIIIIYCIFLLILHISLIADDFT